MAAVEFFNASGRVRFCVGDKASASRCVSQIRRSIQGQTQYQVLFLSGSESTLPLSSGLVQTFAGSFHTTVAARAFISVVAIRRIEQQIRPLTGFLVLPHVPIP